MINFIKIITLFVISHFIAFESWASVKTKGQQMEEKSYIFLEKLGLLNEGIMREKVIFNDQAIDQVCMALLKRDWDKIFN